MPELPDIEAYIAALSPRVVGSRLERVRLATPFLLRSVEPPLAAADGHRVVDISRLGKRLVFALELDMYLVLHLMIAGRLRWRDSGAALPGRVGLAAFDFETGTLVLTEAGTKKRAALHVVAGRAGLAAHDPGGLEVMTCHPDDFGRALRREAHTLKRALTDPTVLSGIGGAYSDEILHRAGLSPFKLSTQLSPEEMLRLHAAAQTVLREWRDRLVAEAKTAFPEKVTAFRPEMAVHGRYREPCPRCATPVQRIRYADNETNYCPTCQTGGRLLADRSLSRLLREDWPKTVEELEARRRPRSGEA